MRLVDWRYEWTLVLRECGKVPEPSGDKHVARIFEMFEQPASGAGSAMLPEALLPYRQALDLWFGPDELERAVLESYLLAHGSIELAARALRLSPEVVQAYEATFFNVVDRLSNRGYLLNFVIGVHKQPKPTLGFVLRHEACAGGPLVLDDLLWHFGLGHFALGPAPQHEDPVLHDLRLRMHVAGLLLPHARALSVVGKLANRLERLEQLKRSPDRYNQGLLQARFWLIKELRRKFGTRNIRKHPFLAQLLAIEGSSLT